MTDEKVVGGRVPWTPGELVWEAVTGRGPWVVLVDEGERKVTVQRYEWDWHVGWRDKQEEVEAACLIGKRPGGRLLRRFLAWCWRLLF